MDAPTTQLAISALLSPVLGESDSVDESSSTASSCAPTSNAADCCYALGEILVFDAGLSQMGTAKPLETMGNFPMNQVAFNS